MKINVIFFILVALLNFACSSKPPKKDPDLGKNPETAKSAPPTNSPSMEAKQLANEQETSLVTEFNFKKGSETLTAESKKRLESLSKEALKKGRVEVIKVITWADQDYPSAKRKSLTADQVALANNRNTEIKNYLKRMYPNQNFGDKIELISMAERPGFTSKLFSSEDARIKRSLETSGIPNSDSKNKMAGKKSKSIVLIKLRP